ncbi:MAG: DUF4296 domain-containing protein [Flavobacteriaceae bacterium]|nr:DUF4296 domain-containing protein [Flavobacteriaceae bacterium]
MKRSLILFVLLIACEANTANPPPAILIPEDTMEQILYDINLLKTIKNNRFGGEVPKEILNNNYILRKYNIADSTLKQNQIYYAQSPKRLSAMYNRIYQRLEKVEDSIGVLAKKEQEELDKRLQREKDRAVQKSRDSIFALMLKDSIDLLKWKDDLGLFSGKDSILLLKCKDSFRVIIMKDSLDLMSVKDSLLLLKREDSLSRSKENQALKLEATFEN